MSLFAHLSPLGIKVIKKGSWRPTCHDHILITTAHSIHHDGYIPVYDAGRWLGVESSELEGCAVVSLVHPPLTKCSTSNEEDPQNVLPFKSLFFKTAITLTIVREHFKVVITLDVEQSFIKLS